MTYIPANNLQNSDSLSVLRETLKQAITVKFTKKDGTERIMYCTTNFELIPEVDRPKPKPVVEVDEFTVVEVVKAPDPKIFKVYEFNNGWRSFNFDQVIEWTVGKQ